VSRSEITELRTLVHNVIDTMVQVVQNQSSSLTNDVCFYMHFVYYFCSQEIIYKTWTSFRLTMFYVTPQMLNVMSSGVRTVIGYNDAVLNEDSLEKCLSILRAVYKLQSSETIDYSSMQV
jgi:hypothetical protein